MRKQNVKDITLKAGGRSMPELYIDGKLLEVLSIQIQNRSEGDGILTIELPLRGVKLSKKD